MSESEADSGFMCTCVCLYMYNYIQDVAERSLDGKMTGADRQAEKVANPHLCQAAKGWQTPNSLQALRGLLSNRIAQLMSSEDRYQDRYLR